MDVRVEEKEKTLARSLDFIRAKLGIDDRPYHVVSLHIVTMSRLLVEKTGMETVSLKSRNFRNFVGDRKE